MLSEARVLCLRAAVALVLDCACLRAFATGHVGWKLRAQLLVVLVGEEEGCHSNFRQVSILMCTVREWSECFWDVCLFPHTAAGVFYLLAPSPCLVYARSVLFD